MVVGQVVWSVLVLYVLCCMFGVGVVVWVAWAIVESVEGAFFYRCDGGLCDLDCCSNLEHGVWE